MASMFPRGGDHMIWRTERICEALCHESLSAAQMREAHHMDPAYDHRYSLGELIGLSNARIAFISAPATGPREGYSGYPVQVMPIVETLVEQLHSLVVAGYDFAGSSSSGDCQNYPPDDKLSDSDWKHPNVIRSTQWCRYWMGRVRATLSSLLMASKGCEYDHCIFGRGETGVARVQKGTKIIVAISILGGDISQVEYSLIPGLIAGTIADLDSRNFNLGNLRVYWIHFRTIQDVVKAFQGYGRIDVEAYNSCLRLLQEPAVWEDGPRDPRFDLLHFLPHDPVALQQGQSTHPGMIDPDVLREQLLYSTPTRSPNAKLLSAITSLCSASVLSALQEGADPNVVARHHRRPSPIHLAVQFGQIEAIKHLIDFGADVNLESGTGMNAHDIVQIVRQSNGDNPRWRALCEKVEDQLVAAGARPSGHPIPGQSGQGGQRSARRPRRSPN
eukprot:TRINITY_DN5609_c0_g3_i1.p1 TRINITY_DN5609_c0_g3~~TRINITY_DN5609_c0_g3_i1.p1  ORF type:complete len:445 (-),score=15.18 TRINITY_DN5609_c0_g3_i1:182-1516(-)